MQGMRVAAAAGSHSLSAPELACDVPALVDELVHPGRLQHAIRVRHCATSRNMACATWHSADPARTQRRALTSCSLDRYVCSSWSDSLPELGAAAWSAPGPASVWAAAGAAAWSTSAFGAPAAGPGRTPDAHTAAGTASTPASGARRAHRRCPASLPPALKRYAPADARSGFTALVAVRWRASRLLCWLGRLQLLLLGGGGCQH